MSLDNVLHTASSSLLAMALDLALTYTPARRDVQILLAVVRPGEMGFFFLKKFYFEMRNQEKIKNTDLNKFRGIGFLVGTTSSLSVHQ